MGGVPTLGKALQLLVGGFQVENVAGPGRLGVVKLGLVNIGDHGTRVVGVKDLEELEGHETEAPGTYEEDLVALIDMAKLPDGGEGGDAGAAGDGGEGGVNSGTEPHSLGRGGQDMGGKPAIHIAAIELLEGEVGGVLRVLRERARMACLTLMKRHFADMPALQFLQVLQGAWGKRATRSPTLRSANTPKEDEV